MRAPRPRRSSPAAAMTSASTSPPSRRRSRVSTFPWSGTMRRSGRAARTNPARRGLSVPTVAFAGRLARDAACDFVTSASRGSALAGYAAITSSDSSSRGTSLALWTATSISPCFSAVAIAATKMPSPGTVSAGRTSPSVTILTTSTSWPARRRRPATQSLWVRASMEPRVPSRILIAAARGRPCTPPS